MLYLITFFVFATIGILILIPDGKQDEFIAKEWKEVEGVILEVNRNASSSIDDIKVKFVTENLEWIIGSPQAWVLKNKILGHFEGDKVKVFYNTKNPSQFTLNKLLNLNQTYQIFAFMLILASILSLYKMFESVFEKEIVEYFTETFR